MTHSRKDFTKGAEARKLCFLYFKKWCLLCDIRPKEAARLLEVLTELDEQPKEKPQERVSSVFGNWRLT
jgi:hypothetical protein